MDLRAPSADRRETLPRDHYLLRLDNPGPIYSGALPWKISGAKNMQNLSPFYTTSDFDREYFGGSGCNLTKLNQGTWLEAGAIKWTLILQGVPPTKFGRTKNVQNSARFLTSFHLIANICGMDKQIENRKSTWSTTFHPLLGEKIGELWSTNHKVIDAHVEPLNWTFFGILNFDRYWSRRVGNFGL